MGAEWALHAMCESALRLTLRRFHATILAVERQQVLYLLSLCFAALVIQHEMRIICIDICGLSRSKIFLHITS